MTSPTNPTWYDVLGVSHDATPAEIKAAWRNATDKFEPGSGSGQFRMFNEAADVLLDPDRRAAYDRSLGADRARAADVQDSPIAAKPPGDAAGTAAPASWPALIIALVLTLLTVGALVAVVLLAKEVRSNAATAEARDEAPGAAERAAKSVFEYDYRHLAADRKRAEGFLTGSYKADYAKAAKALEKQKDGGPGLAVQTKAVVTATALASGVVDADEDSVRVLVYVNQVSQKAGGEPQIFQNRVAMTMEKEGKEWLLSKVDSY